MNSSAYKYHAIGVNEVLKLTGSEMTGLTTQEAKIRLERYGPNELKGDRRTPWYGIWFRQFRSLVVVILLAAALISVYYQHWLDAGVVVGIILLNAVIGFVQEFRAEKAIDALKQLVSLKIQVYRAGQLEVVPARELVVGDVMYLTEGMSVPADARIIKTDGLELQESALTGESLSVEKNTETLNEDIALADMKNMVFTGTAVVRGGGLAVVTATDDETALGEIASELRSLKKSGSLFESKANDLSRQMAGLALILALITFLVGWGVRGIAIDEVLPFTLAALVSAIPESLPLIFMVVLTISAKRMAERRAIVRRLTSPAALGAVEVIITDKTGTITQNQMRVEKVVLGVRYVSSMQLDMADQKQAEWLGLAGLLVSEVKKMENDDGTFSYIGDPTEKAYVEFGEKLSAGLVKDWRVIMRMPFDQTLKLRAVIVKNDKTEEMRLFAVGAPEGLLGRCDKKQVESIEVEKKIEEMTSQAMRTIGFATKQLKSHGSKILESDLEEMEWLGIVGMADPERPEVAAAIASAIRAGVRVIMATGDHPRTAGAIASRVGLVSDGQVVTAKDMESMTDDELYKIANKVSVFARMTPQSKLRLAQVLQSRGMVIAMTGDGVNDAPALKGADVGLAMGKGGTDVAREAGDIVLADDNFATIVAAIEEGRTQFRNLRRTSFFLVTTSVGVGVTLVTFMLFGLPLPLLPKQILWLNLVGGGVTDVALATEPVHDDVLVERPRRSKDGILTKRVIPLLLTISLLMVFLSIGVFWLIQQSGGSEVRARTAVFVLLSMMQLMNVYNLRSLRKSVFDLPFLSNRAINITIPFSLLLLLAVVYLPPFAMVFEFEPLIAGEIALLVLASFSVLVAGEIFKFLDRRVEKLSNIG